MNQYTYNEHSDRYYDAEPVPKKRFGTGLLSLIVLVLIVALVVASFFLSKEMRRVNDEYNKVLIEEEERNAYSVVKGADGTLTVSGTHNGIPFSYNEDGKILEGVSIAGIQLGNKTYEQARLAILGDAQKRIEDINIRATVENATFVLVATDFRFDCDVNPKIHEALKVGREAGRDCYTVYIDRERIKTEGVDLGGYSISIDEQSVRETVDRIAAVVDKTPTEPYITLLNLVGGGKPGVGIGGSTLDIHSTQKVYAPNGTAMAEIQFHNGHNGYVLNKDDMVDKIIKAFNAGDYHAELELKLEETEPSMTAEELVASTSEISRFSTKFASSSDYRARNVQKAAGLLHCVVMTKGEEYSYNELLGPRNEKDGWLPAPGISGGKEYIDSPGGGICQVSSTLYNALLQLGPDTKIVRRYHHSIPGSYIAKGLDATVSYGGPDLVFKIETDTPMLLFSYADMKNRTVYSIIYGVPNAEGATYKIWSETVETIAPPESKIIEEPMWPKGYKRTVINARTGYNVDVFRQKYDKDGNAVGEPETLYRDKYAAVAAEIHVGTGSSSLPIPTD